MTVTNFGIWETLAIISAIGLFAFRRGKNAVWGGLTIGAIVGLVIAIIYFFKGDGFIWRIVGKAIVIGTLAGIAAQLLGIISDRLKKKQR